MLTTLLGGVSVASPFVPKNFLSGHLTGWQDYATSRRTLAALDDRMLRDIGIDRATAGMEASKPFWRD